MDDLRPEITTVALANVNGALLAQEGIPTPAGLDTASAGVSAEIQRMVESHPHMIFEGICISVPGRFDASHHREVFAPNLHWLQFDLKLPLEQTNGLAVEFENAAYACVLSEEAGVGIFSFVRSGRGKSLAMNSGGVIRNIQPDWAR